MLACFLWSSKIYQKSQYEEEKTPKSKSALNANQLADCRVDNSRLVSMRAPRTCPPLERSCSESTKRLHARQTEQGSTGACVLNSYWAVISYWAVVGPGRCLEEQTAATPNSGVVALAQCVSCPFSLVLIVSACRGIHRTQRMLWLNSTDPFPASASCLLGKRPEAARIKDIQSYRAPVRGGFANSCMDLS